VTATLTPRERELARKARLNPFAITDLLRRLREHEPQIAEYEDGLLEARPHLINRDGEDAAKTIEALLEELSRAGALAALEEGEMLDEEGFPR
jgi:hypothetical protein